MLTAHGTVTIRPKEVIPIYREEWNATVTDYKYDFVNRDFVSRGGNLYQVKIQRPGQFVPAGIDPDSVAGADYWELFNPLKPSATNFLVIIDEDGKPQTLMSGGRIQTKFLNIGSLKMSETRLWGGAELFTGKGLALVNDPGDRRFVVYNDANNYVEMFQREDEWGLKGRVAGKDIFQLGNINKIGPFSVYNEHLYFQNKQMSDDLWMSMLLGAAGDNNNGFDLYVSWIEQSPLLPIGERTAMHVKLNTSRNGQAILAESRGYRDNTYNYAIRAIGNCKIEDGSVSIDNGDLRISNGRFGGTIRNITINASNTLIENNFLLGFVTSNDTVRLQVKIRLGFYGQVLYLANYTRSEFRVMRNDNNTLATRIPPDMSSMLYCNGETWLPVMTGDLYYA